MPKPDAHEPAYLIRYLGSTPTYDVYSTVIYPRLGVDHAAQEQYKEQVRSNIERAKNNNRKAWAAVDLSYLTLKDMIPILYRIVLPFVRAPMIVKSYGAKLVRDTELDESIGPVQRLMQSAFRYTLVADRNAALPPGFEPTEPLDPPSL